ncbi:MAG TPA: cytochrome c maturation protein CcmE [Chitinophagaceae bacterium]
MKKIHIIILVFIAASIGVLISFMGDLSTYDTVASAAKKEGKFVHLIAKLDKSKPIEFDPAKNPNYLSFTAVDTLGNSTRVVYLKGKPTDFEKAERLVLQGSMRNGQFECKDILMKCPSKYKDDPNAAQKTLKQTSY